MYREQELTLVERINKKEAERLNILKDLRDGYLDAVQAQSFGAGKFEKIIITRS
jgi:uncharacterized protein (UPF0335 family)